MCFETRPWLYGTGRRRRELMIMIVSIRQKKKNGEIHKVAKSVVTKKKTSFLSFLYVGIGESAPRPSAFAWFVFWWYSCIHASPLSSLQTEQDICRREQNKEDEMRICFCLSSLFCSVVAEFVFRGYIYFFFFVRTCLLLNFTASAGPFQRWSV